MTSKAWRKERSFPSSLTFHPRRRRLAALSPELAALTARPRCYRLGRPRARRGSRLTSAARVSSARAPVRSSVRSAVERDKQWQRHSALMPTIYDPRHYVPVPTCHAGLRVRIRLPPAESLPSLGPLLIRI